ncbi:hypothetical protein H0H92_007181, partial [Tricholoma furcatifolium]
MENEDEVRDYIGLQKSDHSCTLTLMLFSDADGSMHIAKIADLLAEGKWGLELKVAMAKW